MMKTLLKIILGFAAMLFALIPLIFGSTYLFTGFSKAALLKTLEGIPEGRFWMFGVSLFLVCFYAVFKLLWSFLHTCISPADVKVPRKHTYRLEDDNIGERLKDIDLSRDSIISDVSKILCREPDICNCDGRDMPTYMEDGKRWCPQCGYEVQ